MKQHDYNKFLTDRRFNLFGHMVFIFVCLSYTLYCAAFYSPFIPDTHVNIVVWGCFFILNIGLAYLNIYFLMPCFLYRRRYMVYAICLLSCITLLILSMLASVHFLDVYRYLLSCDSLHAPRYASFLEDQGQPPNTS